MCCYGHVAHGTSQYLGSVSTQFTPSTPLKNVKLWLQLLDLNAVNTKEDVNGGAKINNNVMVQSVIYEIYLPLMLFTGFQPQTINGEITGHVTLWRKVEV